MEGVVVVTTYDTLTRRQEIIVPHEWAYVVLDEGHKIRNPDSGVTQAAKHLLSVHRLIMSGAPVQNSLRELWYVLCGGLGSIKVCVVRSLCCTEDFH